jgi:tetratricopeptide (TPR) repeat protein
MRVPFRLHRLPTAEPASALLLPGHDVTALLTLCARLGAMPAVYPVAAGFLLKLAAPTRAAFPGALRLRALADNLLVPADAELLPALRDDEAAGLVRRRGLVFLPGGRALAFAPDAPLPPAALLTSHRVRREPWQSFPDRPALADRLHEVLLERPAESADAALDPGDPALGSEEPRPEDASPGAKVLGGAKFAAGRGLIGLGRALGLRKLAEWGAGLVESAVARVPRLSESVLGRQEAALRALLREFREGNLERALRRALPLGGAGDRGGIPARGARLPVHGTRYSLADLIGPGGDGPAGIWLGGYDVQHELAKEYRKAAEAALRAGDFRRAAFVYGKLLRDYRSAAQSLMQGGLNHDAAVLYLEKLGDTLSAARAFDAAGEVDRAVRLYRQRGDHLPAAALLRRVGEEEAALVEYRAAADQLLLSPQGYLAAGELMLHQAGRVDLAAEYFGRGWALRPEGNAVPCALQLADLHAQGRTPDRLLALLGEAEAFFRPPGNDQAATQFYNHLARLAERPDLDAVRDDLRDRCLLGLAGKLRQNVEQEARAGDLSSALLGRAGAWAPAVVSDAQFAVQAAVKRPRPAVQAERRVHSVRIAHGSITAACFAPLTGAVFLGCAGGEVACFRPVSGRSTLLLAGRGTASAGGRLGRVTSLATDAEGQFLAVLQGDGSESGRLLSAYLAGGAGEDFSPLTEARAVEGAGDRWLAPLAAQDVMDVIGLWTGGRLDLLRAPFLGPALPWVSAPDVEPATGLVLRWPPQVPRSRWPFLVLLFGHDLLWWTPPPSDRLEAVGLGWTPARPPVPLFERPPVAWLRPDPEHLELAGRRADGSACWSRLHFGADGRPVVRTAGVSRKEAYHAVTLVRPGLVAAVGPNGVDWLCGGSGGLAPLRRAPAVVGHSDAVACFPSAETRELLVVRRDGFLVRVPVPN